jgi:hypothetical protein
MQLNRWPDLALRSYEDWDLWLRVAAAGGKFWLAPDMRSAYRVVAGSMSKNVETMWRTGSTVLRKHARLHPGCGTCREARDGGLSWLSLFLRPSLRNLVRTLGGHQGGRHPTAKSGPPGPAIGLASATGF